MLITAPGILIYNSLPMNGSSAAHRALYEGGDKIALMLWVGGELIFVFIVGLEEVREIVLFLFVLCVMSKWHSQPVHERNI